MIDDIPCYTIIRKINESGMASEYLFHITGTAKNYSGPLFAGVDGGGTKTQLVLLDEKGRCIIEAIGPGCNYFAVGKEGVAHVLRGMSSHLASEGYLNEKQLFGSSTQTQNPAPCFNSAFLGIAGIANDSSDALELARYLTGEFASQVTVQNDAYIAWHANTKGKPGILIISGTGSNGFAIDEQGRKVSVGGWGRLLGDEGSGFDMGTKGIKQAILALEARGPATSLSVKLKANFTVDDTCKVIQEMTQVQDVAVFSMVVHEAAQEGDEVALNIIESAAVDLAGIVKSLFAQCDFTSSETSSDSISVIGQGGCFSQMPILREKFAAKLVEIDRRLSLVIPSLSAAEGAAILALNNRRV